MQLDYLEFTFVGTFEGASFPLKYTDTRTLNPTVGSLQLGTFRHQCLKGEITKPRQLDRYNCPPSFRRDHEDYYISRLESPWSCEEGDSSTIKNIPFHIVNVFNGRLLGLDADSGEMVVNTPTGDDDQKWTFVPSCDGDVVLTNLGSSSAVKLSYNRKEKTISKDQTFALNSKRKGLQWEEEVKYEKITGNPWKRYQWEMIRA